MRIVVDSEDEDVATDSARLFYISDVAVWIPTSQIEDEGLQWIEIPEWLAIDRGIEACAS